MATYQGDWNSRQSDEQGYAYNAFVKFFGREPSDAELAQATAAYQSGDPNRPNTSQGDAFVAQMSEADKNTPDKLYAKQQAEYLKESPKHYDSIKNLFKSRLGRDPDQKELDHFGSLLASGTTDAYSLDQFLQQQPEYQTAQNTKMREGLSSTMAANDTRQFSEQILPSIQQAFAKQGRSFDSSGFQNAATQSAQAQNTTRESFLNNLTAQQYGGVQDRAYADYAAQVANQQNLTNQGIQAKYGQIQNQNNRVNNITDYSTQAQMYNQYLAKYGKRNGGWISDLSTGLNLANSAANLFKGWGPGGGGGGGGSSGGGSY